MLRAVSSAQLPADIREIRPHYRSGTANLGRDFFLPCLKHCVSYQRAVAFFSSSSLITWADALPRFVELDNLRVELLISPFLSERDQEALKVACNEEEKQRLIAALADHIVMDAFEFAKSPADLELRMQLFAWMVATDRLVVRIAFPSHVGNPGIFHEKFGVFAFPDGATIAFTGSANESTSAHERNYESIHVFRSWVKDEGPRVNATKEAFQDAWQNEAPGLVVVGLSREALGRIKSIAPTTRPENVDGPGNDSELASRSGWKWRHQDEAIEAFLAQRHGVLEMATGTGKTRTALKILKRLAAEGKVDSAVIAADGNDLLDQWYRSICEQSPVPDFSVTRRYRDNNDFHFFAIQPKGRIHLCSRQRLPQALKSISREVKPRTLLIHDEVHRLGSPANRRDLEGLESGIVYRLGLSATPEREYDEDGTAFIDQHIGPTVYEFPLEAAISRGILCPFDYRPIPWRAGTDDRRRIQQVYKQAAARDASGNPMSQEEIWMALANVYKTSQAKLPPFRQLLQEQPRILQRCIVFVATRDFAEHVMPLIHEQTLRFHTYFEGDKKDVLKRFSAGKLDCLVACHRLSEGIDVRTLRNVVLLSADRARLETIQRIGRCLRVNPSDPDKRATVVDFVRVGDEATDAESADMSRRDWLQNVSQTEPEEFA